MFRTLLVAGALAALAFTPSSVRAETLGAEATLVHADEEAHQGWTAFPPLDRPFVFGLYGTSYHGAYNAGGIGARARLELVQGVVGVQVFAEGFMVEHPTSIRHDYPVGFDLYTPIRLSEGVRLRPFLGMCAMFSFIEPENKHAPRADDLLFGAHTGLGIEVAVGKFLSLFLDGKVTGYVGHDRSLGGWSAALDDELSLTGYAQVQLGVQVHLGRPW